MSPARIPEQRSTAAGGQKCGAVSASAGRLVVLALAAVLATAILAPPAGAAERWYTVEIIVFDDLRNEGLQAEHWPADPGEPSLQGAVELGGGPEGTGRAFRLVGRSARSLNDVWRSLRRSRYYRPFLHAGWRIPGLSRRATRPAYVGPRLGGSGAGAAGRVSAEQPMVRGTVGVSLARYLHVELDLLYHRPASGGNTAPDTNAIPTRFRLVSERRIRSRELHYFDHPVFGVLVLITPFQSTPQ